MIINLKVKTLDSQTHEFSIDNEITIRQFKDKIAEKTNIAAEQQRIIYCGRVLADDKQVKEYDVDGKVVHVAERPPPSSRTTTNTTSGVGIRRSDSRGMRNSPLFRALDGMVVGAMAIPMNAGVQNPQTTINPLTSSSSSFCMNRITVARHMLNCANNIAAYLEDPERGLNNTSLDILAQGRWTMESTVVEVGITDIQQNNTQNLVEALQGAVSAALRQNGNANVTVVQLPTVFNGSETSDTDAPSSNSGASDSNAPVEPMDETTSESTTTNAEAEENAPGLESTEPSTQTDESAPSAAASSTPNAGQSPSRQRTGTHVLAQVIQQMRTVQARLNPFIDQYYELLQNEPTFEENDTTGRENSQRLFDRVSEAFHYLSHAQHAISDLMLDVSRPAPRYLCCRPILVEQSGYVSSNNYTTYSPSGNGPVTIQTGSSTPRQQAAAAAASASSSTPAASSASSTPATATAASTSASADNSSDNSSSVSGGGQGATATPPTTPASAPNGVQSANASSPIAGLSANHQLQVARLIQAVVNSAPIDADFHVQINAPSILSIGVPLNANMRAQASQSSSATAPNSTQSSSSSSSSSSTTTETSSTATTSSSAAAAASSTATTGSDSNTTSTGLNQARVDTTTHPTTSTQTRSTARPQVQVSNIPSAWNSRVIPANMLSSFDRFLPCNSHHIRDNEARENGTNNNNNSVGQPFTPPRVQSRFIRRVRRPNSTSSPGNLDGISIASSAASPRSASPSVRSSSSSRATTAAAGANYTRNCLRNQLISFIGATMFDGSPVSEVGMSAAVEKAIQYLNEILIFLPQYDTTEEYNSRASVEKLVRLSVPLIVNLINDSTESFNFESRLRAEFKTLFDRLFGILFVCVGQINAELYWAQIKNIVLLAIRKRFKGEALSFLSIQIKDRNSDSVTAPLLEDVKRFLVSKDPKNKTTSNNEEIPMDIDSPPGSSSSSSHFEMSTPPPQAEEELPPVIVGSHPWHRNFPASWLPVITRDIALHPRDNVPQPPFSDAYISGMSAKRRKLIQSTKPPHDVKSLLAESVRRAIQTTGLQNPSSSNPTQSADEISNAIATDTTVQASFCETIRSGVKERLKTDTDFKEDKFPHTSKYFNKQN
ncbi:large proline-rich protein BAG6 isoform X2 [Episyrphus balteatus]|uniref:large proline-rich protein BAG6 isoform X2 n=1 Tax=Episyrphus balteatus TaxID=286459 RepID=UPI002485A92C|nr:large proline-rich protein BAG6 isoform X2 [Episyrphus balteatus]